MSVSEFVNSETGLTQAEVQQRISAGKKHEIPPRSGRSVRDIVRANVFTRINFILGILFVLVLTTGSFVNSAFGLLIVVNSSIGIIQELRARRTLETLTLVGEEHPIVLRDGIKKTVNQEELVLDDIICLGSGNEVVVDGVVVEAEVLAMDESMLTGEADPVLKQPGDKILSGSYVVMGTGKYQVTHIGADSYAAKIALEASKFSLKKSQLQESLDTILKYVVWVLIPVGVMVVISQIELGLNWYHTVLSITGALVPMVPEGLILITSTAFALGVIRLGQRKCLVNELPAIEGLARVDVVCADKTGTLTENKLKFTQIVSPNGELPVPVALAHLAYADNDPNMTVEALLEALPAPESSWTVVERKPFNSSDKFSSITFSEQGTYGLGAPDVLLVDSAWADTAQKISDEGLRVLAFGKFAADIFTPEGLLVFEQTIRPDVVDTLNFFAKQDVEVKIISGDNARSVGAVTRRLGLEVGDPIDAREIKEVDFVDTVNAGTVFGRVTPQQKQDMVQALQKRGHNVAMTGDGANDILALKDADIGVAMGSGAPASRSVAKIVLLDNQFATLPHVVAEGRRVIGNIERVANLFITKTIYSAVLSILVLIASMPFPFMPIHVTITGWFTIGIPAFVMALPPNYQRAQDGFVRRILSFAIPAGIIVGTSAFVTYYSLDPIRTPGQQTAEATAALLALIVPSTWVLACVARPWNWWKMCLIVLPLIAYGLIFTLPVTQRLFSLDSSNPEMMIQGLVIGLVAAVFVELVWRLVRGNLLDPVTEDENFAK